ncbi:transcription termination/antitermination NusG family protein [Cohnella thermotolerans]|uniref:transcription termination/antitermination NusG family protein n=1 Tax=Cohnella thermotolerans TaxID=329858 RepID=UPI00047C1AEF|nr:transcription termination/antitermination NusG family protein [Cohnella thermotolerans]
MGAAFAVQVMTGRESAVKKLLEWAFDRNEQAQKWVKSVHAFTQGTTKLLNGKLGKRVERPVVPGYIFVEMNYHADDENYTAYLSAEIWHLIRRVPGVLKLFADAGQIIGSETFRQLFERLETQDQVEITVPDQEAEKAAACVAYNDAETPEAKKEAEQELKQIESLESRIKRIAERMRAFVRNGRKVIRVPYLGFLKAMNHLEQPILRNPDIFMPRLFGALSEVMLN